MKVKTAEATGLALDWGVGLVLGKQPFITAHGTVDHVCAWNADNDVDVINHADHALCIGLIEQYGMSSRRKYGSDGYFWECRVLDVGSESRYIVAYGKSLVIAVTRLVIAMKLGDEFEVPELGVAG